MRSRIHIFCLLLSALLLSGCSLFVEELEEEGTFKNVPVHTGKGYDAPETVNDGGCEVTYQYNSSVRVLNDDEQDAWITNVESDQLNAFIIIRYSLSTPADKLPVPGEILVSGITARFPWGCNHLVQQRSVDDGGYRLVCTYATLTDTFKELDINGTVTSEKEEQFVVMPEPVVEEETSGDEQTRSGMDAYGKRHVSFDVDGMTVDIGKTGITFTAPFLIDNKTSALSTPYGTVYVDAPREKNFLKVSTSFSFDNFSISNKQFEAEVTETVENLVDFTVKGAYSKSFRIHRWRPLTGKAIAIGPVVVVFFINIDLSLTLTVDVPVQFKKHEITETVYTLDMNNKEVRQKTTKILDEPLHVGDVSLEGSVDLKLEFSFGLGLYGKILSIRLIPTFDAIFTLSVPLLREDDEGNNIFYISGQSGIEFKVDCFLQVGVFFDLSLENILGSSFKQVGDKADREMLKELEMNAKQSTKYYQDLVDNDNALYDPNKKHLGKDGKKEKEGDRVWSFVTTIPIGTIIGPFRKTWFPKINDNSFKTYSVYDSEKKNMKFFAEYKIADVGFFAGLGMQYTPAVEIRQGGKHVSTVFPSEGGKNALVKTGGTYTFNLPNIGDNKMYEACPCYFKRPVSRSSADALDKGLPFCATTPSVSISDVRAVKLTALSKDKDGIIMDEDFIEYDYSYQFDIDTYTIVRGAENISPYWWITEYHYGLIHRSNEGNWFQKKQDGTYLSHWSFTVYTDNPNVELLLGFTSGFLVNGDGYNNDPYYMTVYSNGKYTSNGGKGTFPLPKQLPSLPPGTKVKARLKSVERVSTPPDFPDARPL